MKRPVPDYGDIVTLNLDPTLGHEQKGFRPAVVISQPDFNMQTGLVLICPITSKVKGGPFEVVFESKHTTGAVLANQVRTVDLKARKATIRDRLDYFSLQEVIRKVKLIIES